MPHMHLVGLGGLDAVIYYDDWPDTLCLMVAELSENRYTVVDKASRPNEIGPSSPLGNVR